MKKSASNVLKQKKEYSLLSGKIPVYLINHISHEIDLNSVLGIVEENVPASIISLIEGIYIGNFQELTDRNIQAMFKDGVIYLSTLKELDVASEMLMAGNIVHELAHALEDKYGYLIYQNKDVEQEYQAKKEKLFFSLRADLFKNFSRDLFFNEDRVDDLDSFLFHNVGYDKLSLLAADLFTSPYSITSIREYFANGVEDYLLGDYDTLKHLCPKLFKVIKNLIKIVEKE